MTRCPSAGIMAWFAGFWVSLAAVAQPADSGMVLGVASDLDEATRITGLSPKPARFETYAERFDFIHDNLQISLQRHVEQVDLMMLTNKAQRLETPPSRFRITPYLKLEYDSGLEFSFEPDVDVEVDLPNLEKKWKVFIESSRRDDLPGTDPGDADTSSQIGLRRVRKYVQADLGVKFRWPPVVFVRAEWKPRWSVEHTVVQPRQRFFYESDEGFGSLTSFTVHRWFGRDNNWFWQSVSAAKHTTRSTEGTELEQTVKLALVSKALEDKWTWKRVMGVHDIADGHMLRYSLFGNYESGVGQINRHRVTYTWRQRLYKKWIYLEVSPGVEFENDNDWDPIPQIMVGFDMLFWGTYER